MSVPRRALCSRYRPSAESSFCSAFSRTEQVLSRIRSASSGWGVRDQSRPASASTIRALSDSFIWQPKVCT